MEYAVLTYLGEYQKFDSADALVESYWYSFFNEEYYNNLRIYDCYTQQRVDIKLFINVFNKKLSQRRSEYIKKRCGNYKFRNGPVKGTGKRLYHGGMRLPRTKQELSQPNPTRVKRKNLPTSWEDIWRRSERNWKSQRKTQYKESVSEKE